MASAVGVAHEHGAVAVGLQDPIVLVDALPELSEERRVVIDAGEIPRNPALRVPDHVGVRRVGGDEVHGAVAQEVEIPGIADVRAMRGQRKSRGNVQRKVQPVPCDRDGVGIDVHADGVPSGQKAFDRCGSSSDHRVEDGVPRFRIQLDDVPHDLRGPVAPVLRGVRRPAPSPREAPDRRALHIEVQWSGRHGTCALVLPPREDGLVLYRHWLGRMLGDLKHDRASLTMRR